MHMENYVIEDAKENHTNPMDPAQVHHWQTLAHKTLAHTLDCLILYKLSNNLHGK